MTIDAASGAARMRVIAEKRLAGRPGAVMPSHFDEQRLMHELQVHQIELEMQNEALVEHAQELEVALENAEASMRAKTRFLANMGHELLTPLNGVIGLVQILQRTALDAQQKNWASLASTSALALTQVLVDILEFSKLESGKLALCNRTVDLRNLAQQIIDLLSAAAADKGLILSFSVDPAMHTLVSADTMRINQVLSQLLSNAVKFTDKGTVKLRVNKAPGRAAARVGFDRVRFEVEDTGPGISKEDLARLFQNFTQLDDSATRRHGGTGLGLAICRESIRLLQGEIGANSVPGSGSIFWFEIDLARA